MVYTTKDDFHQGMIVTSRVLRRPEALPVSILVPVCSYSNSKEPLWEVVLFYEFRDKEELRNI
jgi:hypothetical protein